MKNNPRFMGNNFEEQLADMQAPLLRRKTDIKKPK